MKVGRVDMRNCLWTTVAVFVVLTSLSLTQVTAISTGNGNYVTLCQQGPDNWIQCSGRLLQNSNGCVILAIVVYNAISPVTQYYTLHDLPSSSPYVGSMVTVTGQLYQGLNYSPSGAACPGNYINVTTIT